MSNLDRFMKWIEAQPERQIPLEELTGQIREHGVTIDDVSAHVKFGEDRYQRNLVGHGPAFYALVMCWLPGQASPIHDHRGASCGVCVLQGEATEIRYEVQDGKMVEVGSSILANGGVCGSFDADIHKILNRGDEGLVTLHVYSPYLNNVHVYDEDTGAISLLTDPYVEANLSAKP